MEIRYTSAAQWADARDGVIPAPYALEAGESITDRYLEPLATSISVPTTSTLCILP